MIRAQAMALLGCLLLAGAGRGSAQSMAVAPYQSSGDRASQAYKAEVNGTTVFVAEFHGLHYAHLSCDGEAKVIVNVSEPVATFTISPLRRKIAAKTEGNTLQFVVDPGEPRYLLLAVNKLPHLAILIDPPERDAPGPTDANVIDASRFVSDATGQTNVTKGFDQAIAAVNGANKTLYVGPGCYLVDGLIFNKVSNCRLYLAPGCLIRSVPVTRDTRQPSKGLELVDCQNIVVAGRGVIDNGAYESFVINKVDTEGRGDQPVKIIRSSDITVEGITVRNARNWNYWGSMSDRVTLRYCKALSPPECNPIWTDGYNFSACQTLLIENCFAYCTDDSFASGHYWEGDTRDQKDYVIRGLVAWNPVAHGIRLGFFTEHNLGDITFESCDFLGYRDHGLYIHGRGFRSKAPTYGRIRLVDCSFEADPKGCLIRVGEFGGARMDRLELVNVSFAHEKPSIIQGDPQRKIKELLIENLSIGGRVRTGLDDAGITVENVGKGQYQMSWEGAGVPGHPHSLSATQRTTLSAERHK